MVKRSSIHKILVAVLVSASLVGCGVSNETDSTAGSESSVDIKAASSPDSQAIEKVNTLFSMAPAAQQAKEVATAQCLQEQNLTWPQRPTSQSFSIRSQLSPSPLSPEDAQQYGYQTPTEVPRFLFLGLCLNFHYFSTGVVFPKLGFDFSRRAVAQALVEP